MIKSIRTKAHFTASGATLMGDFQPQTGLTAVVGENGSGKTFQTIEAIRWLLYGKKALRGAAGDYDEAEAVGVFTIHGADYTITRGKKESISADGKVIAVGAEKVTERVTELMGYGLDVFDLCNAATQGNVQELGKMKPAERKALIDKVLRLTDAETAEKDCRAEAKARRRDAETLAGQLRVPSPKPAMPANYSSSNDLTLYQAELVRISRHARDLQAQVRHVIEPEQPKETAPADGVIEDMQAVVEQRRELMRRVQAVPVLLSEPDIEAAVARFEWEKDRDSRGPKPVLSLAEIDLARATWATIHGLQQVNDMETTCPKCDHKFRTREELPPEPAHSLLTLQQEENRNTAWAMPLPPEPLETSVTFSNEEAARYRDANVAALELASLSAVDDRHLDALRARRAEWDAYDRAKAAYDVQVLRNKTVEDQIAALGLLPTDAEMDAIAQLRQDCLNYEHGVSQHEQEQETFDKLTAEIVEKNRLAEEFKKGAEDVGAARAAVKALIAPRISQIATVLINDMSMGKLTSLTVNEDMEITVGRQRIETLSGAGKTVANLALRVAMGQALVARAFPVFLADEIDGDLSVSRREATLMAMAALKKHLTQIILVTHRDVDVADHIFPVTV